MRCRVLYEMRVYRVMSQITGCAGLVSEGARCVPRLDGGRAPHTAGTAGAVEDRARRRPGAVLDVLPCTTSPTDNVPSAKLARLSLVLSCLLRTSTNQPIGRDTPVCPQNLICSSICRAGLGVRPDQARARRCGHDLQWQKPCDGGMANECKIQVAGGLYDTCSMLFIFVAATEGAISGHVSW